MWQGQSKSGGWLFLPGPFQLSNFTPIPNGFLVETMLPRP